MTPTVFTLSLLALLVSPGPTNTLIALGGAARGLVR
jgi:threonine/homoserine/homoserine lactone efflux protein